MRLLRSPRLRLAVLFAIGLFAPASLVAAQAADHGVRCGNGRIDPGEPCDDGNRVAGDGCDASCRIEKGCYDPGPDFSFIVWSDSYGSSGDGGVEDMFRDAMNGHKYPGRVLPRFWIAAGDIPFMADGVERLDQINEVISREARARKLLCAAGSDKFPYFVALGNHDVDGYGKRPQTQLDYWSNYVGKRLPMGPVGIKNFRFGPGNGYDDRTTYSFDYKDAHFVVVNQYFGDPTYPTAEPQACIRPKMLDWIDRDLAATDRSLRFVFGHEAAWPYCSGVNGYGGEYCPSGHRDRLDPAQRPRPYSPRSKWLESFGLHWGDSLDSPTCPKGSREAFWAMLARHRVAAHFVGHSHTYSSRLVQGNGTPDSSVSPYAKKGESFGVKAGVWEVDSGQAHNSSGAVYVLATVKDQSVVFESYDRIGSDKFHLVETWTVYLGAQPPPPPPRASAPALQAAAPPAPSRPSPRPPAASDTSAPAAVIKAPALGDVGRAPVAAVPADHAPVSTRFRDGSRVKAVSAFRPRSAAEQGELLAILPGGARGRVKGSPAFVSGAWWWEVDFEQGPDGWCMEDWIEAE